MLRLCTTSPPVPLLAQETPRRSLSTQGPGVEEGEEKGACAAATGSSKDQDTPLL